MGSKIRNFAWFRMILFFALIEYSFCSVRLLLADSNYYILGIDVRWWEGMAAIAVILSVFGGLLSWIFKKNVFIKVFDFFTRQRRRGLIINRRVVAFTFTGLIVIWIGIIFHSPLIIGIGSFPVILSVVAVLYVMSIIRDAKKTLFDFVKPPGQKSATDYDFQDYKKALEKEKKTLRPDNKRETEEPVKTALMSLVGKWAAKNPAEFELCILEPLMIPGEGSPPIREIYPNASHEEINAILEHFNKIVPGHYDGRSVVEAYVDLYLSKYDRVMTRAELLAAIKSDLKKDDPFERDLFKEIQSLGNENRS